MVLLKVSLTGYHTFRTPAVAHEFVIVENESTLKEVCSGLGTKKILILGSGSNVLFTTDFDGIVLLNRLQGINLVDETEEHCFISVSSGVIWDDFVAYCVKMGYWGIENLSYIPGTVGAAPVQNIGAYGQEAADTIETVDYLDLLTFQKQTVSKCECNFGYRESIFKKELKSRAYITSVVFKLQKNGVPSTKYSQSGILETDSLNQIRDKIIAVRTSKLPDVSTLGNAGSFFKNPVVSAADCASILKNYPDCPVIRYGDFYKIPAGWLIEQCGWKGKRIGDAGVYTKQALVLVNFGKATGKDILLLANAVIDSVRLKFAITIEPEVNIF